MSMVSVSKSTEDVKNAELQMVEFKTPNPVKKKPKPKILTEEKYIDELSRIIQRDFFPDLEKLRAQNSFLDAMDRNDLEQLAVLRAKYSGTQYMERSRSMTPTTFETPANLTNCTPRNSGYAAEVCNSDTPKSTTSSASMISTAHGDKVKSLSEKHTLDSFLQAYTSEDNYSFQEILTAADERLRQKFAVLYNEEKVSAQKLALALTLPSIEEQFVPPDPLRKIETWNYKNKNCIMYTPEGVELTDAELLTMVNRKQSIDHSNTRLADRPVGETSGQSSSTDAVKLRRMAIIEKIGVDGNNINQPLAVPQIRGFNLVKTPSPRPGEAFSPLMTWGEIEGTPFRLDGSDTPIPSNSGPSFKINATSRRESIALSLAEKVGEKLRAQKQRAMNTARKNIGSPFIRSNRERLASMSPAARQLATSHLSQRSNILTPSPLRTPPLKKKSHVVIAKSNCMRKTPIDSNNSSAASTPGQGVSNMRSTLTDDLLKIPTKRLMASDFF